MTIGNYKDEAIHKDQNQMGENPNTPPNPQNTLSNNSFNDKNMFNSLDEYDEAILAGRDWRLYEVSLVNEMTGEVFTLNRVPITVDWASCPKNHSLDNGSMVWYLIKQNEKVTIEKRCQFFWHLVPRHSFELEIHKKWMRKNLK